MATNADEKYNIDEYLLRDGHVFQLKFKVPNVASLKTLFTHDFGITCDELSTSWKFGIEYHEVTEDKCLSFTISLKRMDSVQKKVRGYISVTHFNGIFLPIYNIKEFQNDDMRPGCEIQENVLGLPPLNSGVQRETFVNVSVSIKIHFCHSQSEKK